MTVFNITIDCDLNTPNGKIDSSNAISGTFDVNGLLTSSIPDVENPSHVLVLSTVSSGSLCPARGGDFQNWNDKASVIDAIGVPDAPSDVNGCKPSAFGLPESTVMPAPIFPTASGEGPEPFLIFRDGATNAWNIVRFSNSDKTIYVRDVDNNVVEEFIQYAANGVTQVAVNPEQVVSTKFDKNPAVHTFGAVNPTTATPRNGDPRK